MLRLGGDPASTRAQRKWAFAGAAAHTRGMKSESPWMPIFLGPKWKGVGLAGTRVEQ